MTTNPLLEISNLPNHAPAFDKIKEEHYLPAAKAAIETARENIKKIKEAKEAPDFENTIVEIEVSSEALGNVMSIFYNQLSSNSTDGLHKLAEELGPIGAAFSSEIAQDEALFVRVKKVYEQKENLNLTQEQKTLLEETYKSFVRGGALLPKDSKKRLREINERLAVLSPSFMNNNKKSIEAFEYIVEDPKDLSGLPESIIDAAANAAKEQGHEGKWLLTLDMPMYAPVIQYADNREMREKIWLAYNNRAWNDEFDNSSNVLEIANIRHERANLLGYNTHADFILEKRMTETPETVWNFLHKLKDTYYPGAQKDIENIKNFAKKHNGPEKVMQWDISYYAEKLKQELYEFTSEDFRPYFPLEKVLDGVFQHFSKLFNINFKENKEYPVWNKDVVAYDVFDNATEEFLGTFYGDFHPRKGKKDGAWMTTYRDQGLYNGKVERPVISICCNFPKPTETNPSLLSHGEVTTLLHEMGHAMHGMLAKSTYQSLSGVNVLWDFVELPSQVQENWAYKKETLDMFASHYKTGEKIPEELIEKLNKAKNHMASWSGLRQIAYGILDMCWHDRDPSGVKDIAAFEDEELKDVSLYKRIAGPISTNFTHIFAGGYSAGLYSYKWAEVLDADTFELFEEKGLYDRKTADAYRHEILEKGGSIHPAILYRNFRGRDADPDALLRREGLV